ncbi:MAG: amidohydrolase family protein [Cyclobacteriaceae bacterium]
MKNLFLWISLLIFHFSYAQETFHTNGVVDERPGIYAFTNATIYVDHQQVLSDATLIMEKGKVLASGQNISIPGEAIVIDLDGKFIYPAFIDPYTNYGISNFVASKSASNKPQYDSERKQAFGWNDNVKSDFDAVDHFVIDKAAAVEYKKLGFGAVSSFRKAGIVRGTALLTNLSEANPNTAIIKGRAAANFSFTKGDTKQQYPKSIMGSVALICQTYYDANWYEENPEVEYNLTLEAFNANRFLPQVFEASGDKLRVLLADKIGDEFGAQYIIKGNGDEYQRIEEIKGTQAPLILPVNFPMAYDVADPLDAREVTLAQMKHWELAPYNAKMLSDAGVTFALTTDGLKSKSDFWSVLRKIEKTGLSKTAILKSLTAVPASYFGVSDEVGALRKGMQANFFIASGDMFDEDSKILETWVGGERNPFDELSKPDYSGKYSLVFGDNELKLELIEIETGHSGVLYKADSTIIPVTFKTSENATLLTFDYDSIAYRLSGWIGQERFGGIGSNSLGEEFNWKATELEGEDSSAEETASTNAESEDDLEGETIYPFVAYGWTEKPKQETILFKNATIWTMEDSEPLEEADVLIGGGKILKVGKNLEAPDARVIDAMGKHLTPGIIDEHSHIALSSVNEGSSAIVAEVRMYDAVNSEDINIYRQLSGGVVAAQLLHGSANPVGGQSALVKFRWGSSPEEMKIEGADGFIKFALGENVKQSNWGDHNKIRFPQTRMGVEQVYMDGFTRAKEYGEAKAKYDGLNKKAKAKTAAPRTDLRLETLLEIINQERFITCHSYVQSEINMLMEVAERFDFTINTFTHILEGYKVADKMKEHGAGGSTFSDWWAYKFEVRDAIPYNAALMHDAGITVAINSDNAEMARRLNQEAAKSVKYGGMSEMEALKMVTINPAKLLHLDDRMGSIKVGKDADVVLWSDHPLSIYAQAEYTLVDGIVYYSVEKNKERIGYIKKERSRLINKMLGAKSKGEPTQKAAQEDEEFFHCDSEEDGFTETFNDHD